MRQENFEDALAVAPKVSLKYWQKCLNDFQRHLSVQMISRKSQQMTSVAKGNDPVKQYVEYSILVGDFDSAV